jgi:hypothetical protein
MFMKEVFIIKKIISIFLVAAISLCLLSACKTAEIEIPETTTVTTTAIVETTNVTTTASATVATTTAKTTTTAVTTTAFQTPAELIDTKANDNVYYPAVRLGEGLVNKDEDILKEMTGYVEGENGYLYNVDFESYEVHTPFMHWSYVISYVITLDISDSNDPRFPVGKSDWLFAEEFGQAWCLLNMDEGGDTFYDDEKNVYYQQFYNYSGDGTNRDRAVMLAYAFEHSFYCFSDIPDMSDYKSYMRIDDEDFYWDANSFEYFPLMFITGDRYLTQEYVDRWYYNLLGIEEQVYEVNRPEEGDWYYYVGEGGYKSWEAGLTWRLEECTDETITITYFADKSFLTPAKTIKYLYEINDGIPRLLSSKIITDYGYEPAYTGWY